MTKAIAILAGCLIAAGAFAGDPITMPPPLVITPQTNATAVAAGQVTTPVLLYGWLDTIIIDVGGSPTPTNTITFATVAGLGTGPARTFLTLTDVAADASYPVRDLVCNQTGSDISNVPAKFPLVGDQIIVSAYGANTTTNTLTVYLVIDTDN